MTTLRLTKSIGWSPLRLGLPRVQPIWIIRGFLLLPFALAWFAFSPQARAVCHQGCDVGNNTFLGNQALIFNITGSGNTAIGSFALYSNTTGQENVAIGEHALLSNTTGSLNTAIGHEVLLNNTTGSYNTANGFAALILNTIG
ncbi:MAG TPA: hypothetical protein VK818_15930, partial [Methylomirabilota bacterium]|nr:hypothetical protein [Methylomirabilota bacterium]